MFNLNTKQLVQVTATLLLFVAGDIGDFVQSRQAILSSKETFALIDNLIHVVIGLLSWAVVDPGSALNFRPQFILVGIGASVIDLDHFLAARSFRPDAAFHAKYRGILHCSGILLIVALLLGYFRKPEWMLIFCVSFIPHHLRDSTRRGLYIFLPYIHTPPLPVAVVRILYVIFPWVMFLLRIKLISTNFHSSFIV